MESGTHPASAPAAKGWFRSRFPQTDPFSHDSGHLWHTCIRHPQYVGFVLIMSGFLLQWPSAVGRTSS